MSDFLADNNLCGQSILRIVSTGNAILANLFRLSTPENIPTVFRLANRTDQAKYGEIIFDLRYFTDSDTYEKKIEQSSILRELDDELRESYAKLLTEYYEVFESIFRYITDLNKFIQDVNDGFYIQINLENILSNGEGKQLLTESLYLYGCMLLLLDQFIDGPTRERMMTSFYRYTGRTGLEHSEVNVDDVCKLVRSAKKVPSYPLEYFQRIPIDRTFVQLLLGRLRSDDIYNQLGSYPLPDHRTTALGPQASLLVIILFFSPNTLQNENSTMREISDKFFHDNWIVPIYMGFSLNLIEAWDGFRAAKMALELSIGDTGAGGVGQQWPRQKMEALTKEVSKILKEGVIVEENILEKANHVITLLRECNVRLRWTILHSSPLTKESISKKSKQMRDNVVIDYDPEVTLSLLLHVAQLELKVRDLYKKLLREKQTKWNDLKAEAVKRVKELAEFFSGNIPLTRIEKNEKLSSWLETKATLIDVLDYDKLTPSGRQIAQLIPAFNEMLEFHNLEANIQVREWVNETTGCLLRMLRTGSVNEDVLVTLQIVADLGYAWGPLIDIYTEQMQKLIQKDPFAVSKLRAVFLKLSSAMDMPLLRQSQSKSNELVPVSSYYSGELVSYVQKVLQIIPESIFRLLHEIIELQTTYIQELPTRLDKERVKEYAQLEHRGKVSRLTHDMSILTEGILMMQSTLVGIIRIDPKLLLELGIRKELIRQLIQTFNSNHGSAKFAAKLEFIAQRISGIQRSFEYIGDYVSTQGLVVFQLEFARLINFATEQECNRWSKQKVLAFQSVWQSKDVPIAMESLAVGSGSGGTQDESASYITFMGKIVNELIGLTDPKLTIYLTQTATWYDIKTHVPVISPEVFKSLEQAVDVVGLVGIDKILCFLITKELQKLVKTLLTDLTSHRDYLGSLHSELEPPTKLLHSTKSYAAWIGKVAHPRIIPQFLTKIGQLQLLRKRLQYQLRVSASLSAKQLYSAVDVMNQLMTMTLHDKLPDFEEPSLDLISQSEPLGIYEPLTKVYTQALQLQQNSLMATNKNNLALYLALVTIAQTKKMAYDKKLGILTSRKSSDTLDSIALITGITTVLMQMSPAIGLQPFLSYMCQYLNSVVVSHGAGGTGSSNPTASAASAVTSISTQAPITLSKDDDFSSAYVFIKQFIGTYPRADARAIVKLVVPCYEMLSTFIN